MKNGMVDLRNHLFATLEALQDKQHPMEIERALAVARVADTLVETAKVEVKLIEARGGKGTGFISEEGPAPGQNGQRALPGGKQ